MPEVFIDHERYEFESGEMALQFIFDLCKEVPSFCYHPAMSIPANCRQFMVKVGQYSKDDETSEYELYEDSERKSHWFHTVKSSCSLKQKDGMVIQTQETSEEAERAQKDTLEFLIINHPQDSPICDQAGECPLQIQ